MGNLQKIQLKDIDIESNVYHKDNQKLFNELVALVEADSSHASRILKYTRKDIMQWIDNKLPLLQDNFYSIATKVNWILTGRTDFPECEVCHNKEKFIRKNVSILYGYPKTCSGKCAHRHPDYKAKIQQTNIEKYGTPHTFQSKAVKDKIKQTFKKKYGVEYIGQAKEVKEKIVRTNIEKYGCLVPFNSKSIKDKTIRTILSKKKSECDSIDMTKYKDNVYCKNNPAYFKMLVDLVIASPCSYSSLLDSNEYSCVLSWINESLPMLKDPFYLISTKVYWILNNMTTFPVCPICGKDDNFRKKNVLSINTGYYTTCSDKCAANDPEKLKRSRQTSLERYGCEIPQRLDSVKAKQKETCLKKYGVESSSQSKQIKDKMRQIFLERYGSTSPFSSAEIKEKIKQTNIKKYGAENPFASEEIKKRIAQTNIKKFGVDNPSKAEEIKQKKVNTCLQNYGVENPMQSHEIRLRSKRQYTYDNLNFDSAPEIAFYIWLKDNNIEFTYQPTDANFEYVVDGKTRKYIPDFKIGDEYVEIKGSQFLKEDGTWRNPFDKDGDENIEIKHQCLLKNGVKIMYEDEYVKYLEYVEKTYGKDFIQSFRNKSRQV